MRFVGDDGECEQARHHLADCKAGVSVIGGTRFGQNLASGEVSLRLRNFQRLKRRLHVVPPNNCGRCALAAIAILAASLSTERGRLLGGCRFTEDQLLEMTIPMTSTRCWARRLTNGLPRPEQSMNLGP